MKKESYIVGGVLGAFVIIWLAASKTKVPPSKAPQIETAAMPKPAPPAIPRLPKEYITIAETLAQRLLPSRDQFGKSAETGGEAEALARLHGFVLNLKSAQSAQNDLNYIAGVGSQGYSDYLEAHRRLSTLPDPPDWFVALVKAVALNHFAGPVAGARPVADNLANRANRDNAVQSAFRSQALAMEQIRAASILLPKIAKRHAPNETASPTRIRIDFDENWGATSDCDWLMLYNAGPDLSNVTVCTKLTGDADDTRENVHFVANWPGKTWLHTRYDEGQKIEGTDVWRTTVANVKTIEAELWSPALRWKTTYQYHGAELEKDIARICESVQFTGRFVPFEEGIFLDTESKLFLTMDGAPRFPFLNVAAEFSADNQSKAVSWTLKEWPAGKKFGFPLSGKGLGFVPNSIKLTFSFPPTAYSFNRTMKLN